MELIPQLIDFVLHVDRHLDLFVQSHGAWVYALLFVIIFVETGLVVMPLLPGDSLLFVVGAMCGAGLLSFPLAAGLMLVAAVLGDQCNYTIGRYVGPRVFQWNESRLFNKAAFDKAHAFYETYGGFTIIAARFMPFLRTFVPFVGGVAQMNRAKFTLFNVVGGCLWVCGVCAAGYFLGSFPWVKAHLDRIIWAMILVPGLLVLVGTLRAKGPKASI
jgi:membrane-associated protein